MKKLLHNQFLQNIKFLVPWFNSFQPQLSPNWLNNCRSFSIICNHITLTKMKNSLHPFITHRTAHLKSIKKFYLSQSKCLMIITALLSSISSMRCKFNPQSQMGMVSMMMRKRRKSLNSCTSRDLLLLIRHVLSSHDFVPPLSSVAHSQSEFGISSDPVRLTRLATMRDIRILFFLGFIK